MKKTLSLGKQTVSRLFLILTSGLLLNLSCSNDDNNPIAVDEEEVITTINVSLSATGASTINLQSQDLDGDGPDAPELTISGSLNANTTYMGTIGLLNETITPADNIAAEVAEEDDEHQFFFAPTGAITGVEYDDQDENGNPVGLSFTLTTGDAGNGTLQITLRHEPKKPNDGTLSDAGGETDIAQIFSLTVE